MREPPKLAHRTGEEMGAFGYLVIASIPSRARVPSKEKNISHDTV